MQKEHLTVSEASKVLGCHQSTVYRYIKRYKLQVFRTGLRPKILLNYLDIVSLIIPGAHFSIDHKSKSSRLENIESQVNIQGK